MSNSFYDDASWVLIPEGIKEDVVYAQKPTNGTGDLTFTRASDATRTNSAGVIERTPWNLLTWSEMFSDVAWVKTQISVGVNTTTAPNGTLTADTILDNAVNDRHRQQQTIAITIGRSYTYSIYVKKIASGKFLLLNANAAIGASAALNLDTLEVTNVFGSGATVTSVGDGWYRLTVTGTGTSTNSFPFWIQIQNAPADSAYIGDGNGFFIWGAQLVEGTDAKPYFATTNRQDVPRLDYRNADGSLNSCPRLLLEPQRTNSIRNSTMVGAVAGSPGTLPTNWSISAAAGLTQTVVGAGTENGLPYIDLRFNGTASASALRFKTDADTAIAALPSQIWTSSCYFKLLAGVLPYITLRNIYRNAGSGAIITPQQQFDLTSTLTRRTFTDAGAPALTAFVQQEVLVSLVIGQTFDFTIRIAAPQMELGAYATTWVPTTTAAVTRIADTASKTGVSSLIGQTEGTLFVDITLTSRSSFSYFAIAPNLGATNTYIGIGISASSISFEVVNSGIQVAYSFPNTSTGSFKLAFAYKANDFVAYVNGALVHTDTSGTVPTCSQIGLNAYNNAASWNYNQAALFPTRLTNAQLAQLTTL